MNMLDKIPMSPENNITITSVDIEREFQRRKYQKLDWMFPETGPFARDLYVKHLEFFEAGSQYRERLMRAANRVGKTECGAYETTLHLTGLYPSWWKGKRFTKPTNCLIAGETGKLVRDSIQEKMLGPIGDHGSGMIPKALIESTRPRHGTPDAVDIVQVMHVSGLVSLLQFQSYDQGREAFQATARDVIWLDEEPPLNIYTEALTRTMTTKGIVMTTFTPLKGQSDTVLFLEKKFQDKKISLITATWNDAPHLDDEAKAEMLQAYPPHQRDARSQGIPSMGSGAIYPVPEEDIVVKPFDIPKHWRHAYALDVGWNNTAAIFGVEDTDTETVYIVNEYKRQQSEPSIHATAVKQKAKGEGKPGVIDPASRGRSQQDGQQLIQTYRELGLNLIPANNAVETGIYKVWEMLSTGKLKIFSSCYATLEEYRMYRRDEKGKIVKQNDHCMDALRYYVMSGLDLGKPEAPKAKKESNFRNTIGSWMGA